MGIQKGDKIKVGYVGSFDDGTIFDSTEKQGRPLEFEVGSGQIIKGFDEAVKGMEKGEGKKIKIPSAEAYGEVNPKLIGKMPRSQLLPGQELKVGMILKATLPNGVEVPARIIEVATDTITIDLNHPLAGKTLNFKIKVLEVES